MDEIQEFDSTKPHYHIREFRTKNPIYSTMTIESAEKYCISRYQQTGLTYYYEYHEAHELA